MKLTSANNLVWADALRTSVTLDVTFEELGNEVVSFHATSYDNEPHGRDIYARAINGEFGAIAEYQPNIPKLTILAKIKRNALLAECDHIVMPDYPNQNKEAWVVYRQALRDVPDQSGFPENIQWPTKPE